MKFTGGRKIYFGYADFLRKKGHDVSVLVQDVSGDLAGTVEVEKVLDFSPQNIPECDLIVTTTPKETKLAWDSKKGKVVHFCQGYEITDLEKRISGKTIPNRYKNPGIINSLKLFKKRISWKKKIERINKIYQLPTHLVTIAQPLKKVLEERYNKTVQLCVNGIPEKFFFPRKDWTYRSFNRKNPLKIVNIGPIDVTFKGILTTIDAVKKAKESGLPVKFIRITPKVLEEDKAQSVVDEIHEGLKPEEVGEIMRNCDVYISNSTDGEGFGLPAVEALCSGLVCIYSKISSYSSFSERRDYCYFVEEYDVEATFNAIKDIIELPEEKFCELRKNSLEVSSDFSYEKSCNRFEEILLSITDK